MKFYKNINFYVVNGECKMFKRNQEIRKAKGIIPFWVIAERLAIHENTLHNWMKTEMSRERKKKVMGAIKEIKEEMKKEGAQR